VSSGGPTCLRLSDFGLPDLGVVSSNMVTTYTYAYTTQPVSGAGAVVGRTIFAELTADFWGSGRREDGLGAG
jgi:hypothetical protein